ncbi:hypothetical protein ED733_002548 [Metarhizium rileyi]|uniref:Uncharacterized protein n=1 Tax=Metarhizium rileyi (strain RCEF 4871) TaxID=1649241 RepID=A0A5C6G9D5_METRR|nr:hypothetical protein ED733_002548 [Metarhizium rileyi]
MGIHLYNPSADGQPQVTAKASFPERATPPAFKASVVRKSVHLAPSHQRASIQIQGQGLRNSLESAVKDLAELDRMETFQAITREQFLVGTNGIGVPFALLSSTRLRISRWPPRQHLAARTGRAWL